MLTKHALQVSTKRWRISCRAMQSQTNDKIDTSDHHFLNLYELACEPLDGENLIHDSQSLHSHRKLRYLAERAT